MALRVKGSLPEEVQSQLRAVIGTVASGVADDNSEPVKVGGRYNVTQPTLADGNRGDLQLGSRGALRVELTAPSSTAVVGVGAAADASNSTGLAVNANQLGYNGATWDRLRTPLVFKLISALVIVAGVPQAIWTPGAGKKFRLMGYALAGSVDSVLLLKDAATEIAPGRVTIKAANGTQINPPIGNGVLSAVANNALNLDATVGSTVSGYVFGTEE